MATEATGGFTFDLVSPERRLASVAAREVLLPGADGDLTAMPGHAPVITTLRPGLLRVVHERGTEEFVVSGGFAEITGAGVSVLAEQAFARGEFTAEHHARLVEEARAGLATDQGTGQGTGQGPGQGTPNEPGPADDAARLLADMVAMGDHIAIGAGPSSAPAPG